MNDEFAQHHVRSSTSFLMAIFLLGLIVGSVATYYLVSTQIIDLRNDVANLRSRIYAMLGNQTVTYEYITITQDGVDLSELYQRVKDSVVMIRGTLANYTTVQGSGFVYNFSGLMVIITNYHVVHDAVNRSVTFSSGNGYAAIINGTDPYADLAVLIVPDAPESEFKPLEIVSSSTLKVGDPVIAIGNPYGLVGSMTTGIISALNRTIQETYTGGFSIAGIIQTSAPINPGNSGGPLLNFNGKVIGVTTAIVKDSQGLGFAIPSNTILREIASLIYNGSYEGHSYLGLRLRDMNYELAQRIGASVTYGVHVEGFLDPSPAGVAGISIGDIIIALNGTRIINMDDLASYLEENTLPGETVTMTVIRGSQQINVPVVLGRRPPPQP
ncbi:MAG: trypsin-like peptidase domain-containing protein [Candidatus Bathyarchaeia archaeon]